jgi:hypothetical protein
MPPIYGCETHMLMVAEIVIGHRACTSPAYVLRAKYWVVDWARTTSLRVGRPEGKRADRETQKSRLFGKNARYTVVKSKHIR